MGSGDDVKMIDESASANVDAFLGVFFEDGHLPGVLSELAVALDVNRVFDSSVDAMGVAGTTLVELIESWVGNLRSDRLAAAD